VYKFLSLLASLVHRCPGSPDGGGGGVLVFIYVSGPYGLVQHIVAHV
jgi:hypothetical protein